MKPQPDQSPESEWHFVQELQSPLWTRHFWKPRAAKTHEASLQNGVCLIRDFPDENGVLETAYQDIQDFLQAGSISVERNPAKSTFVIETSKTTTGIREEYQLVIKENKALIQAADTEGIRRGIFHLEEEMLRAGGPFLPLGEITRTPVIRTRISRCYFGPINRPPKNRDELADDLDYYPDQYLNRLAHHGVNALWLSIKFKDLCPSRFFPEHGKDSERRLAKLRRTVSQCARFGIKIYPFCIEPRAFDETNFADLEKFPALAGHQDGGITYFCTSSAEGLEYLEDCTHYLFSQVPDLGGLIDINLGERPTHCYSNATAFFDNNCPRCGQRQPAAVFADTLAAMQRGMNRANPDAELISWLYMPVFRRLKLEQVESIKKEMAQIAAHVPPKVLLQVNFESHGKELRFGREQTVLDYSLAYVGPSEVFENCARAAIESGASVSAKLQVGNSHEVATIPFVPAPGNLYRKYRKMRELGVSCVMQCWYFGNYPSPMTEAAGRLSFDPLPETEEKFLEELAAPHWGNNAKTVARAWQHFRDAYCQFPPMLQFSRIGPVHDSVVWPLHLFPIDLPMQPSWLLKPQASGDRVPQCFAPEFTYPEILETLQSMADEWRRGTALLHPLEKEYQPQAERLLEIGVAKALGLQLQSAFNVLQFYQWREELPFLDKDAQLEQLHKMKEIAVREISISRELAVLAQRDSRLGFHSEAEGYKYFPESLLWRVSQLEDLLANDFPKVQKQILEGKVLFPEYTGAGPQGAIYQAFFYSSPFKFDWENITAESCIVAVPGNNPDYTCQWKLAADDENVYLNVQCHKSTFTSGETEHVVVSIDPRRTWPTLDFYIRPNGDARFDRIKSQPPVPWDVDVKSTSDGWYFTLTIPWYELRKEGDHQKPLRLNVCYVPDNGETLSWRPLNPQKGGALFGNDQPNDFGWVQFITGHL